ncbi:MAG: HdeD family acid-resistance protein [Candidatus Rokubacteria bacterium]|nr:HdeD family acid-resistance protein [Candidatus Rokubacteria bacterium]
MNDDIDSATLARNWWILALRGAAAVLFGILTFVTPAISLAVLVLFFGGYALADGVLSLIAVFRRREGGRPWWALLAEGIVSIAAGLVTFFAPGLTAIALTYLIAAWAVVTGALAIGSAIRLRKEITGEVWLGLSGALSIVFGVLVMLAPAVGALAIVLWIGAYAIVFGTMLIALAFRLRGRREEVRRPMARAA